MLVPEGSPARAHGSPKRTHGEEDLPGGVRALPSGQSGGEMWILWRLGRKKLLFCGDSIYGQTDPGGLGGYQPKGWMQTDGIRLFMPGKHSVGEMRDRYQSLVDINPTEVFNGHNPRQIANAGEAIAAVLETGKLEMSKGGSTYLWHRWKKDGGA